MYIDESGEKSVDISYSQQNNSNKSKLVFKTGNTKLTHEIKPTGKTVGEPNQDWVIDNFKSHRIGTINFQDKGLYEIELVINPEKEDELKFQWIWID